MAKSKLLTEHVNQDYNVSTEDINIYAQQIGININTEKHLMWIAKKGLSENVPKPWLILADEKDRVFYYNPDTHENSWFHPIDKEYAALVSEERSKSKSLNSASSDYGFESKLSSLADAPPLSSSGKNSPLPLKRGKHEGGLSGKKLDFGRIENRRGAQLAPVRLNALKMPTASFPKSNSGMSFMPKGSTLAKNMKQGKEDTEYENQIEEGLDYGSSHIEDSNESANSDEGSKYSYEETDEDDKHIHGLEPYDMLDTSHLSPVHSVDESPDALDINSLVQFGTKLPPRFENTLKKDPSESVHKKENSPSLSLRKVGQPSFLKPITQATKKKTANKGSKAAKKVKNKYSNENEMYLDDKITTMNVEQQLLLEQIQKDWITLQDELEKKEKQKYEEMLRHNMQKLEEEEVKLRNENSEKLSKLKYELQKRIEEEESVAEKLLQSLKIENKEKISEEEKKLHKELEIVSEALKDEIKKMEEKNASELAQRKKDLEEAAEKELDSLRLHLGSNKKNVQEAHEIEILNLQQIHKQKVEELKSLHGKEVEDISFSAPQKSELQGELQKLEELIKIEAENYQNLLKKKEDIQKEIIDERKSLEDLKNETSEAQATVEKLQDEIEKTENDLDLLRSEKSGFISELNILKENINNEKSNLDKKLKATFTKASSKELSEIGIGTDLSFFNMICKAVQVSILCSDAFSQVEADSVFMSDALCQTTVFQTTSTKSCQTDKVPFANFENVVNAHVDSRTVSDKNLENALSGLGSKLDSRINVIEHQLRTLQENLSKPAASEPIYSSQEFLQNQFTEVKTVPNSENRNIPPTYYTNSSRTPALFSSSIPASSQSKCRCELGDTASCDVLQDVKNSVYRLNDILCANFVPPARSYSLYQVNQPLSSYSSSFDSFYAQFRQMQEKHRLTELKHKCENDVMKFPKESSTTLQDAKMSGSIDKKLPYDLLHSDMYSYNISEDPLNRARTIIHREKAKAWKEQQMLNPSVPHIFSMNSLSECSQSSVTGFTSPHNVPSSEQTFLNFEIDPETDYNMWMTRLNALQLRIRSHKML